MRQTMLHPLDTIRTRKQVTSTPPPPVPLCTQDFVLGHIKFDIPWH